MSSSAPGTVSGHGPCVQQQGRLTVCSGRRVMSKDSSSSSSCRRKLRETACGVAAGADVVLAGRSSGDR